MNHQVQQSGIWKINALLRSKNPEAGILKSNEKALASFRIDSIWRGVNSSQVLTSQAQAPKVYLQFRFSTAHFSHFRGVMSWPSLWISAAMIFQKCWLCTNKFYFMRVCTPADESFRRVLLDALATSTRSLILSCFACLQVMLMDAANPSKMARGSLQYGTRHDQHASRVTRGLWEQAALDLHLSMASQPPTNHRMLFAVAVFLRSASRMPQEG